MTRYRNALPKATDFPKGIKEQAQKHLYQGGKIADNAVIIWTNLFRY